MNRRFSRATKIVPLAIVVLGAAMTCAIVTRDPSRLEPARAWCAPSVERPLGCGEAGVDLLALVAHAVLRGVVLAAVVALVGFTVGTPLGAAAAMASGHPGPR